MGEFFGEYPNGDGGEVWVVADGLEEEETVDGAGEVDVQDDQLRRADGEEVEGFHSVGDRQTVMASKARMRSRLLAAARSWSIMSITVAFHG